ncbi:unnamed protein product [Rotaria magnacalcarata]|uniref:CxC5 like cysteine cluster associated with KDZ domain-containing protein n=1 Tax=Rotaria magnacalcarata TaxID=392030 RepID=A0A819RB77_9BILA|nr:unnamed protein product [Rotaria magnacalcarata]CAF4777455.1 unnamed protein product [Rotaria magnacalcarata]
MDQRNSLSSPRTLVEITDEEHTLILMARTMRLDEIVYVMVLNNFLPKELPNKHSHIMNIINSRFCKSYEIHTIKTIIEFISTQPTCNQMFQEHDVYEMIENYQNNRPAESDGVYRLYLKPYTTQCIQCKKQLKSTFSHRAKTVMSLTKTYQALICTCVCQDCDVEIYPSFYIQNKKKFITIESVKNDEFIYLNGNQIFDQNLLIDFDQQLVQNTVSFEGYTKAYNSKIQMIKERQNQQLVFTGINNCNTMLLNEKNFQMTWLLINIVKFIFMTTKEKIITIPMSVRDVNECTEFFLEIKDELYKKFVDFWTHHQRFTKKCDLATCSKVFIVDGHQKANRLISPNIDHKYCQHHQPFRVTSTATHKIDENIETSLDKLALVEYVDKDGHYDDALCNVFRSGINNKCKISSYGFLATFLNCSVIVGFTEQPCSEGMRRVLHHILTILRFGQLPNAMCYDCACTLKLFINKHFGSKDLKSTDFTQFLTSLTMAIDRFHVKNHTRPMCKTIMRPDHPCHNNIYAAINTEVAEQMFSYLSKFKHSFRGYNYPKSTIFLTILFHLKNCATTGISSFEQAI